VLVRAEAIQPVRTPPALPVAQRLRLASVLVPLPEQLQ
jgi:hypothetical protein